MKKIIKIIIFLLITAQIFAFASGCSFADSTLFARSKTTYEFFGTVSTVVIYDDFTKPQNISRFEKMWDEICELLNEIESELSTSLMTSDIYRFNAAETNTPVTVGEHTLAVMQKIADIRAAFPQYDPTVYPLVDLWGLTPRFNENNYAPTEVYDRERTDGGFALPDSVFVDAFTQLIDFDSVIVDFENKTLTKTQSVAVDFGGTNYEYTQQLDFGGIAKGYAVDKVMEIVRSYGYEYGYFSCGTSSLALLKRAESANGVAIENAWSLGVQSPRFDTTANFAEIYCKDVEISTSGDYQHCYFLDGVRYCHIIDTASGYPVGAGSDKGIAAVTVIGDNAASLDAESTAMCLVSFDEIMSLINSGENYYLVTFWAEGKDYCEVVTNMPDSMYKILDERFVLASQTQNGQTAYIGDFFAD